MIDFIYKNYDSLASTNDKAKQLINEYCPEGTVVCAFEQTDGRGRSGRVWEGENGKCVFSSLVLYPNLPQDYIPCLTLVTALAVRKAIKIYSGIDARIKWPNDIVINDKKVCGILTERIFVGGRSAVVIGVGVNVNNKHFSEEIEDKAISILDELLREKEEMRSVLKEDNDESYNNDVIKKVEENDISKLTYLIWDKFNEYYEVFLRTGNMSILMNEYNECLINSGRVVKSEGLIEDINGVALGINDRGELVVSTGKGKRWISSGEVSVRGLYSYV